MNDGHSFVLICPSSITYTPTLARWSLHYRNPEESFLWISLRPWLAHLTLNHPCNTIKHHNTRFSFFKTTNLTEMVHLACCTFCSRHKTLNTNISSDLKHGYMTSLLHVSLQWRHETPSTTNAFKPRAPSYVIKDVNTPHTNRPVLGRVSNAISKYFTLVTNLWHFQITSLHQYNRRHGIPEHSWDSFICPSSRRKQSEKVHFECFKYLQILKSIILRRVRKTAKSDY